MPRRKPTSTRQKKADTQLKRAVKRGDAPPPDPNIKTRKPKLRRGPTGNIIGSASDPANAATIQAARRLQSAFVTLPPKYLEDTKLLASKLPLHRPISTDVAVFPGTPYDASDPNDPKLTCPRRPKWRFDMTKKEVERNEEGVFKTWLQRMDGLVLAWQNDECSKNNIIDALRTPIESTPKEKEFPTMLGSPTYYERNLEVWRQLWRVTEISQILLVLLDSRCPLLHLPPSLSSYLVDRKVILVLTKVDISGPERAAAWMQYFGDRFPYLRVVQVEAYAEKEEGFCHQGKTKSEPRLPKNFRERLVAAIKEVHAELLLPPKKVADNPDWLKGWRPPVKKIIDWEHVLTARGSKVGTAVGTGISIPLEKDSDGSIEVQVGEPDFLTIGLIGQPNVGKSSLLNALFGSNRVRASKTPGKTKHFQTLFWTADVRLVDCPGLVMPNFVPMEMQVLCGILPISRVSAIPSCIHFASERIPIENIHQLGHPTLSLPPVTDKRTWRDDTRAGPIDSKPLIWTAMDILTAYANQKKWVTAKAGRPDIHRAGNALIRSIAEGRIGWAFWPPGTNIEIITANMEEGATGLWIPRTTVLAEEADDGIENEDEEMEEGGDVGESSDHGSKEDSNDEYLDDHAQWVTSHGNVRVTSRFDALMIDDFAGEDENDNT